MIKIEKFQLEHLQNFSPECKKLRDDWLGFKDKMALNLEDPKIVMLSMVRNGFVIAILALIEQRPHVAEAAIIKGIFVKDFKKEFFAASYRLMNNIIFDSFDLHRVEIAISTKSWGGLKWASKIGCTYEGLARCWGSDGQDHAIYAKVVK